MPRSVPRSVESVYGQPEGKDLVIQGLEVSEIYKRVEAAKKAGYGSSQQVSHRKPPTLHRKPPMDTKMECPVCGHRWLDRHGKDECPKCLSSLSKNFKLYAGGGERRRPGESSTFKQRPGSAMQSESGVCRRGEAHLWRFGRCTKCGMAEGDQYRELTLYKSECERGGKHIFRFDNVCTKCGLQVFASEDEPICLPTSQRAPPPPPPPVHVSAFAENNNSYGQGAATNGATPATPASTVSFGRSSNATRSPPSPPPQQQQPSPPQQQQPSPPPHSQQPNLHRPAPPSVVVVSSSSPTAAATNHQYQPQPQQQQQQPPPMQHRRSPPSLPRQVLQSSSSAAQLTHSSSMTTTAPPWSPYPGTAPPPPTGTMRPPSYPSYPSSGGGVNAASEGALSSYYSRGDAQLLQEWELQQRVQRGALHAALQRLDPAAREEAMARRAASEQRASLANSSSHASLSSSAPAWNPPPSLYRPTPKWRVKPSFIGLVKVVSNPSLGHIELKRECHTCGHRWLDKWRKDECPKCFAVQSMPDWQRHRRLPGEASTFKQPPGSSIESQSGVCRKGGMHHWRYGRCIKCGKNEGEALESKTMELRRQMSEYDGSYYGLPSGAEEM